MQVSVNDCEFTNILPMHSKTKRNKGSRDLNFIISILSYLKIYNFKDKIATESQPRDYNSDFSLNYVYD